jgi:hypothetical protein
VVLPSPSVGADQTKVLSPIHRLYGCCANCVKRGLLKLRKAALSGGNGF